MLSAIKTIDTSNQTVAEYQYSRNANGAITNIAETLRLKDGTVSEKNTAYTYDSASRLIQEEISNAKGSIQFTYGYDETYNRISQTISFDGEVEKLIDETGAEEVKEGEISYTYNALNQLIKESETGADGTSQETIYEYDTDGNLIKEVEETQGIGTDESTSVGTENSGTDVSENIVEESEVKLYSYDVNGYMKSVVIETTKDDAISITQESYGYDAEGVRVWKETGDVRTTYITDRFDTYTQVLVEQKSSGETDYYTRGNRLVCRTANDDSKVFYLYDGHGNVTALTDNLGNVTDNYSYTAYGVLLTKAGETENEYLYCGEQMDATTGLYYLRARYFNPLTATFTQKDSYEGNLYSPVTQNGYLYTGGNPVMYTDPSGNNFTMSETLTAMGIAATLQDVIVSSAYYMILAAEVGITLKLAREAYYAGAFAKLTNKMMEIYDEEEYIPIFVIDDVTQNIIIDTIPEVEPFIEVFPEEKETGNQVILDPLPEQKTLWDVVMWGESGRTSEKVNIPKNVERQAKKLSPEAKKGYEKAIEALKNGDTRGLNDHPLSGNRSGQRAVDIKGIGKGRGAGRIIYEFGEDGKINIVEILTDHRY